MQALLYDFLPVVLFFVSFKLYGIYVATTVGIIATAIQVLLTGLIKRKIDKQQLITLIVFSFFGGLTLYFHNPLFVKWKPSIIFWIFGAVFFISYFVGNKTMVQRMLEGLLENEIIPTIVWKRLNALWILFFMSLGCLNIYIAYHYSTEDWVNFKFYGIFLLTTAFSLIQAIVVSKYSSKN